MMTTETRCAEVGQDVCSRCVDWPGDVLDGPGRAGWRHAPSAASSQPTDRTEYGQGCSGPVERCQETGLRVRLGDPGRLAACRPHAPGDRLGARAAPRRDVEVVLVVNEADPTTVERVPAGSRRSWWCRADELRLRRRRGAGHRRGDGDVIVLVNNDAVADAAFVDRGVAALEAGGPSVAAIAATVLLEGGFVRCDRCRHDRGPGGPRRHPVAPGHRQARRSSTGPESCSTDPATAATGTGSVRSTTRPRPRPLFGFSGGAAFLRRVGARARRRASTPRSSCTTRTSTCRGACVWPGTRSAWRRTRWCTTGTLRVRAATPRSSGTRACGTGLRYALRDATDRSSVRVAARTAARLVRDLAHPAGAQLTPAWRRLALEAPAVLRHARRLRRATVTTPRVARRARPAAGG